MLIFRHPFQFPLRRFFTTGTAYILLFALIGYGWLVYRTAWINDDALITVRTVQNFLDGYGLRWNVDERVQTFTHPLWMLFLLLLIAVTSDFFYTILFFSIVVSLAAVSLLLLQKFGGLSAKLLAVFILCFSQSFIDYSTSGLENPLTHLLLGCFIITYLGVKNTSKRFALLSFISCLAALNRLDTILLFLPPLLLAFPWKTRWRSLGVLLLCFIPFFCWHLFSLFYYGSIVPNTAYAKLDLGLYGIEDRFLSGLTYLMNSLITDPITLTVIALTAVIVVLTKDRFRFALICGVGLYLFYIVWIGGDFMNGRFLSAPLFVSASALASSQWLTGRRKNVLLWPVVIAVGVFGRHPPVFTDHNYGKGWSRDESFGMYGVHDERAVFFQTNSLINARRMNPYKKNHPWVGLGRALRRGKKSVRVVEVIGHTGVFAGPDQHLVDIWGLADPLLARLPPSEQGYGHATRTIPKGYYETLQTGKNHIQDRRLAQYYKKLKLVVRGELFAPERLWEIWNINTGKYNHLIEAYSYRRADRFVATLEIVNPTSHPFLIVYVQNEWRKNSFIIDHMSYKGKKYSVRLVISKNQVTLDGDYVSEQKEFFELLPRGEFTLSVATCKDIDIAIYNIYEYRFPYVISGSKISTMRYPIAYRMLGFPFGQWEKGDITNVIDLTRLSPEAKSQTLPSFKASRESVVSTNSK